MSLDKPAAELTDKEKEKAEQKLKANPFATAAKSKAKRKFSTVSDEVAVAPHTIDGVGKSKRMASGTYVECLDLTCHLLL